MKTSNKILATILGAFTLYIFAYFAEISITDNVDRKLAELPKVDINTPKYIIANNVANINITYGETSYYQIFTKSDSLIKVDYRVVNDTLYLNNLPGSSKNYRSTLLTLPSGSLEGATLINSDIKLSSTDSLRLTFKLDNAKLTLVSEGRSASISINASNDSRVNMYGKRSVDTLNIKANASNLTFNSEVDYVNGRIENNSRLSLRGVLNMNLSRDPSSDIRSN